MEGVQRKVVKPLMDALAEVFMSRWFDGWG